MSSSLLLFFLDAVRYDYVNRETTPFLHELAMTGLSAPMRTILGFDGIAATIATGTYPDTHGIWTQYLRAVNGDAPFRWMRPLASMLDWIEKGIASSMLRKSLRVSTIAAAMMAGGMKHYPGAHEVPYRLLPSLTYSLKNKIYAPDVFPVPTVFDILRQNGLRMLAIDHPALGRDTNVVARALKTPKKVDLTYVRLMDLDETTHAHGTRSLERVRATHATDNAVREIVEHYSRMDADPWIMIFADHGMIDVQNTMDVPALLSKSGFDRKEYSVFLDSTMARFWGDHGILGRIAEVLQSTCQGRILDEDDRRRFRLPGDRYGQLIYLANPGTLIFPSYYATRRPEKATHGYDPSAPGQDTLFIVRHPDISGRHTERVNLVDIAPTILDIFGVKKPDHFEGRSLVR